MKTSALALLTIAALAACAPRQYLLPVVGMMQDGSPMQGQIVLDLGGEGRFTVENLDGFSCSGTYDVYNRNPTIRIPITCSDGRFGDVLATRSANGVSGTATAKLTDGTTGRFVFGEVAAEERARFLGGAGS